MVKIFGPYTRKQDGRKHVVIQHADGHLQTKSYPKFLLEQKLDRELIGDETTDHIDEDFTNDDLGNLQPLNRVENAAKSAKAPKMFNFICPTCGVPASKRASQVAHNQNRSLRGPYCSRRCAGIANQKLRMLP
jgi:endogenous inhibitor of DNA gyrase (YacG/DUF329 family)